MFKKSIEVPGDIVECGVFKGTSFLLFCKFLKIYDSNSIKKIVGFDTFGKFPSTTLKYEKKSAQEFIEESKFKSNNNDLTIDEINNKIFFLKSQIYNDKGSDLCMLDGNTETCTIPNNNKDDNRLNYIVQFKKKKGELLEIIKQMIS